MALFGLEASRLGLAVGLAGALAVSLMPTPSAQAADADAEVTCVAGVKDTRDVTVTPLGSVEVSWSGCTWMQTYPYTAAKVTGPATLTMSDAGQSWYSIPSSGSLTIQTTDSRGGGTLAHFAAGAPGTDAYGSDGSVGGTVALNVVRPVSRPCVTTDSQGEKYNSCWKPISLPKVVGSMTVGSTITANSGRWKPTPYFWFARWYKVLPDGSLRFLSKRPTYTIKAADRGSKIMILVIASHPNYGGQAYSQPRLVK